MGEIGSTGIAAERALNLSSNELGESGTTQKFILHLNTAPPAMRRTDWLVVTKMKPSAVIRRGVVTFTLLQSMAKEDLNQSMRRTCVLTPN